MSVLINMDMPESCDDCILNNGITCYALPDYREDGVVGRTDDRPDWCPLVPAADVRPVERGKWTDHRTIEHDGNWYCSACGKEITIYMGPDRPDRYRFCPNCGACMEES